MRMRHEKFIHWYQNTYINITHTFLQEIEDHFSLSDMICEFQNVHDKHQKYNIHFV